MDGRGVGRGEWGVGVGTVDLRCGLLCRRYLSRTSPTVLYITGLGALGTLRLPIGCEGTVRQSCLIGWDGKFLGPAHLV